jgi:hypothetical protein
VRSKFDADAWKGTLPTVRIEILTERLLDVLEYRTTLRGSGEILIDEDT